MDIRNHEGYIDEVPWQAIRNVEREAVERPPFLPLVYICAPYSGDVAKNTRKAAEFAAFAYRRGNIPITPHLLFPFLDDENPDERRLAIHMDLVLIGKCKEVWVLGDRITVRMRVEIERTKRRRQPIRYFNGEFQEAAVL